MMQRMMHMSYLHLLYSREMDQLVLANRRMTDNEEESNS
jgi:hypothetical protein